MGPSANVESLSLLGLTFWQGEADTDKYVSLCACVMLWRKNRRGDEVGGHGCSFTQSMLIEKEAPGLPVPEVPRTGVAEFPSVLLRRQVSPGALLLMQTEPGSAVCKVSLPS